MFRLSTWRSCMRAWAKMSAPWTGLKKPMPTTPTLSSFSKLTRSWILCVPIRGFMNCSASCVCLNSQPHYWSLAIPQSCSTGIRPKGLLRLAHPCGDGCSQFFGRGRAPDIGSADFRLRQDFRDGVLDGFRGLPSAEMSEHHRTRPNLSNWVRNSLASYIRCRAMYGLKHGWKFLFRIEVG